MQEKHNEATKANEHLEQQLSLERQKAIDHDHQRSTHTQQLVTDLQDQVQDLLDQRQAYQLEAQKGSESLKRVISELEESNQALQQQLSQSERVINAMTDKLTTQARQTESLERQLEQS
jgi:predicted RNase H-like nuclease (RuvC/YqgF family)